MYFNGLTFIFSEDPPENHLMVTGGLLLKYYVLLLWLKVCNGSANQITAIALVY